jgi:hypothetical protein
MIAARGSQLTLPVDRSAPFGDARPDRIGSRRDPLPAIMKG